MSLMSTMLRYVVTHLIIVAAGIKRTDLLAYGLLFVLLAGLLTDSIVTAAGA